MGLDMYLYTNSKRCKRQAEVLMDDIEKRIYAKSGIAIYWRKANAIHKWFVDHVQDGEDDCKFYPVEVEQLLELHATCGKVLEASKLVKGKQFAGKKLVDGELVSVYEDGMVIEDATVANELLPSQEGFFFGSQDYDEWYLADVRHTYDAITLMLAHVTKDPDDEFGWSYVHEDEPDWRCEFYYHSSW